MTPAQTVRDDLLLEYAYRLEKFYLRNTTFNVRWKKGLLEDSIAPGLPVNTFLTEFSRKELRHLERAGIVARKTFTQKNGSKCACILFVEYKMPQVGTLKKGLATLLPKSYAVKSSAKSFPFWKPRWDSVLWARVALFIVLVFLLVALIFKNAHGFSATAPVLPNLKLGRNLPGGYHYGYFDDIEVNTRCYWITGDSAAPAISCLHVSQASK